MSICGAISVPLGQRTSGRPMAPRRTASDARMRSRASAGRGFPDFKYSPAPTESHSNWNARSFDRASRAWRTRTAAVVTSGPIPSPSRTAMLSLLN